MQDGVLATNLDAVGSDGISRRTAPPEADQSTGIEVAEVQVTSQIEGEQLTLSLNFEATTKLAHRRMLLIQGDAVLDKLNQANIDYKLDYDQKQKAYHVAWAKTGRHQIDATFVAKPKADPNSPWQEVSLEVPSGRVRRIQLVSERPDLEVELPSAMRVERQIEKGQLKIDAILGPHQRLVVRWKPLVTLPDAKLVLSSQANTLNPSGSAYRASISPAWPSRDRCTWSKSFHRYGRSRTLNSGMKLFRMAVPLTMQFAPDPSWMAS